MNQIRPWKYQDESIEWTLHYWQCPDCKGNILIYNELDDIERYKYCPFCGKRRYEDDGD